MLRIALNQLKYDEGYGLYTHEGKPFTGLAFAIARKGYLESETEYLDGHRDGRERVWHPDGALAAEGTFRAGAIHGMYREWHPNSVLAIEEVCEYGILLSRKSWNEQGQIIEEYTIEIGSPNWESLQLSRNVFGE